MSRYRPDTGAGTKRTIVGTLLAFVLWSGTAVAAAPPDVSIAEPLDASLFRAGDVIEIRGLATDSDSFLTLDDLRWTVEFFRGDHIEPVLIDVTGVACPPAGSSCLSFTVPVRDADFSGDTGYRIRLEVTDDTGNTRFDTVEVRPDKAEVRFLAELFEFVLFRDRLPGEVTIVVDGVPRTTPFVLDTLKGFSHTLTAPASVTSEGRTFLFDSWTNESTNKRQAITVPSVDATYTIRYTGARQPERISDGLLALYTFDEGDGDTVSDTSRAGSPLNLTIADPGKVTWGDGTLTVDSPTLIRSATAATKINTAVKASNELTLEAWVRPANTTQTGPARIVSVSANTRKRNVTLGQGANTGAPGTFYDVRLRTTETGNNGSNPSLSSPEGSLSTDVSHVVYTRRDNTVSLLYVDGVQVASGFRFNLSGPAIGGDLSNWAAGHGLVLANEQTGDRPWLGTFDLVAIYDRNLWPEEVRQNFKAGPRSTGNRWPVANPDDVRVSMGGRVVIDVLANDTDDRALNPATVTTTPAANGALRVDPVSGAVTYRHDGSGPAIDSFSYTVEDDQGEASRPATVTVTVSMPGQAPVANNDSAILLVIDPSEFVRIDVLANDFDDGTLDPATVRASGASRGTLDVNPVTGVVTYQDAGVLDGIDTFTYTVDDNQGITSNPATVTVSIESIDFDGPGISDDFATVVDGGSVVIDVLANDFDGSGIDPTSVDTFEGQINGTLSLDRTTGAITYTHDGSGPGVDFFFYDITDGNGVFGASFGTVTITITPKNTAPVANDDSAVVIIAEEVAIDVLANDSDADGTLDPATVRPIGALHGTLDVDPATGVVTYRHTGQTAGTDSFTYTVDDDRGVTSNPATVTLAIEGVDFDGPSTSNDVATVVNGGTVVIDVLANDFDESGIDPASVFVTLEAPIRGELSFDRTSGAITYAHDGSGPGIVSFEYTVDDNRGNPSTSFASVVVKIVAAEPGSLPSRALVLHLEADRGVSTRGQVVTAWADQSGNGNDLTASGFPRLLQGALNGAPVIDFDGDKLERTSGLSHLPSGSSDRTVYVVANYRSRGFGGFAYGTSLCNQAFGLVVDRRKGRLAVQGWCDDFVSGKRGTDSGWLVQSAVVRNGRLRHYLDGKLIDTRMHSFDTVLSNLVVGAELDGYPFMDMQVAAILVYDRALSVNQQDRVQRYLRNKYFGGGAGPGPGPQPPEAHDDSATVVDGGRVVIDVLANDRDDGILFPDSVLVTPPARGTLSGNVATGAVTYTHDGSGAGADSFTYTVGDDLGLTSNAATVTVTITPAGGVPAPPVDGLVVYLEADAGVTTSAGSTVTVWSDQSGRGNDLVASGNPRLVPAAPTGAAVIDFDGNGDKLEMASGLNGLPAGNADRTVLLVANYRSKGFGGFAYGTSACNQAFGTVVNRRKGRLTVQGWCSDFDSGDSGTGQGWLVQSAIHAGGELTHYRDGVLIDNRSHTFDTVLSTMVAGAELDSEPFMDMQIAAVLVYNRALSAAEHQQAIDYLRAKYLGD